MHYTIHLNLCLAGAQKSYHIPCVFFRLLSFCCSLGSFWIFLPFPHRVRYFSLSLAQRVFDLKWTQFLAIYSEFVIFRLLLLLLFIVSFVSLAQNVPMFDYSKRFQVCGTYIDVANSMRNRERKTRRSREKRRKTAPNPPNKSKGATH